jgi:Zn-dependent oligopeptidase
MAYWSERLRRQRYGLDSETVRSYLPLDQVLEGMMSLYQELFDLRFTRLPEAHAWHPETQVYAMTDRSNNAPLGAFVLDLHPRTGKYGHAAVFPVRLGKSDPTVTLVCNFPRATASHPSLLSHEETETLFHEFGHLIHALVSAHTPYVAQNGMAVATDFVEAPSQLLEEWTWHPAVLRRISAHRDTSEPMPDELIRKMLAARHHMDANYYLAQAVMALYDLRMHGQPTDVAVKASDIARWYREMELEYRALEVPDDALQAAGWSHLADYDAGYYGYLWSKVYALDLFTRFTDDPLDTAVGTEYRQTILEPGASKPEHELIHAFLGRAGSDAAFLAALGIAGTDIDGAK